MEKQEYFSKITIDEKSEQMLVKLKAMGLVQNRQVLYPLKAALLVLDLQNYFISTRSHAFIPSSPAIIPNILKLIGFFNEQKLPIFFTQHTNDSESAGMMAIWWNKLLESGSDLADLIDSIDPKTGIVVPKNTYDAFWKTSLDELLRKAGVTQVVISGVMTHLCCESTARSAFVRDYQVFFTVDGTATYTEDLHNASLLNLSHGFAKPVLSDDIVNSN